MLLKVVPTSHSLLKPTFETFLILSFLSKVVSIAYFLFYKPLVLSIKIYYPYKTIPKSVLHFIVYLKITCSSQFRVGVLRCGTYIEDFLLLGSVLFSL